MLRAYGVGRYVRLIAAALAAFMLGPTASISCWPAAKPAGVNVMLARGEVAGRASATVRAAPRWQIPVLMYHRVDPALVARDPITVSLTVMQPEFEAQLRRLRAAGYRTLSLDDVWRALVGRTVPPERGVVLTFDDGYADAYTEVFPLLRRYGFTGTFFIVTSSVGTRDHVTVAQVQEMARAGMEIASHGVHHLDFTRMSQETARGELVRSREILQGWTGRPVTFFAYPAGRYSSALQRLLGGLGYRGALTEVPGFVTPSSTPFALERIRVSHDDSLATFSRRLRLPSR